MRAYDTFLRRLYLRAEGRIDRTLHSYRHIALPLGLTLTEMHASVANLIAAGLLEADPGFDRLIRLTPTGGTACEQPDTADSAAVKAPERGVAWVHRIGGDLRPSRRRAKLKQPAGMQGRSPAELTRPLRRRHG